MRKNIKYLSIIGVVLAFVLLFLFIYKFNLTIKNKPDNVQDSLEKLREKTIETKTSTEVNGYEINFIRKKYENSMIDVSSEISITKNRTQVWKKVVDQDFSGFVVNGVGDWIKSADDLKAKAIKDINDDGVPELFVAGYSGGAHCCNHNYIIKLSDPISVLFDLDTGDNGIEFKDLNNDGVMEIITHEDAFAYWNTSFAASPMPEVILSLKNEKYKADPKYMRKPAPTDNEIKKNAISVESWSGAQGPEVAWKCALDLIYSGNIASAKKYVDLAWKDKNSSFKSKDDFWRQLSEQIKISPYYSELSTYFGL